MTSHYETLGVAADATDDDIKAAYKRLAHETHPDKQGGDEERFKAINEAYEVLSDPEQRAAYDAGGEEWTDRVNEQVWSLLIATMNEDMNVRKLADFIRTAKDAVMKKLQGVQNNVVAVTREKERMQHMVGRITTTESRNLFEEILVARLEHCDAQLAEYAEDIKLLEAVKDRLKTYKDNAAFQNDLQFPSGGLLPFGRN